MLLHRRLGVLLVGLSCVLLLACGDDESSDQPATTSGGGTGAAGGSGGSGGSGTGATGGSGGSGGMQTGPGTITISADGLSGQDGKRIIATVLDGGMRLGAVCMDIASGAASAVVRGSDPNDVCTLGEPVTFDPGSYDVSAGIYGSGAMPEQCAAAQVTVQGDVQLTLPAFSSCN